MLRDRKLYDVLGVEPDASAGELKRAYHAKAKQHHPDAGGNAELFAVVAFAHEVLSDPVRRAAYDESGVAGNGDTPDNDLRQALDIIGPIMTQIMGQVGQCGPVYTDIVELLCNAGSKAIAQIEADISALHKQVEATKSFAARFSVKDGSTNVLRHMVEAQTRTLEERIPRAEKMLALHKMAMAIVQDHSFRFDPEPQPEPAHAFAPPAHGHLQMLEIMGMGRGS